MRTCDGGWVIITAFFFRVTARVWVCVAREAKDPPLHTHAKRICPLEADVSALLEISHTCGHIPISVNLVPTIHCPDTEKQIMVRKLAVVAALAAGSEALVVSPASTAKPVVNVRSSAPSMVSKGQKKAEARRESALIVGTNWPPRTKPTPGEGYFFFQGPTPKTAVQKDLPDFFSSDNFADVEIEPIQVTLAGTGAAALAALVVSLNSAPVSMPKAPAPVAVEKPKPAPAPKEEPAPAPKAEPAPAAKADPEAAAKAKAEAAAKAAAEKEAAAKAKAEAAAKAKAEKEAAAKAKAEAKAEAAAKAKAEKPAPKPGRGAAPLPCSAPAPAAPPPPPPAAEPSPPPPHGPWRP